MVVTEVRDGGKGVGRNHAVYCATGGVVGHGIGFAVPSCALRRDEATMKHDAEDISGGGSFSPGWGAPRRAAIGRSPRCHASRLWSWLSAGVLALPIVWSTPVSAAELGIGELFHLDQKGVESLSWCDDDSLIFVQPNFPTYSTNLLPPGEHRKALLKKFLLATKDVRQLLAYDHAKITADCVRGGEFAFVYGRVDIATSADAKKPATIPFTHLAELTAQGLASQPPSTRELYTYPLLFDALGNSVYTAPDGSVYGQLVVPGRDLIASGRAATRAVPGTPAAPWVGAPRLWLSNLASSLDPSFPVYSLVFTNELWHFGSYRCPGARPGCAGATAQNVVYYIYSQYNTNHARLHALFTITPGATAMQRWPIVGAGGKRWDDLVIEDVVVDERRCYVLLVPNETVPRNYADGRLRLDLYFATCGFRDGHLEFDAPRPVGRREASFMSPHLSLNGDFLVVTETIDMNRQPEDQQAFEKGLPTGECVHIYSADGASTLSPVNSLCGAELRVSPSARYVSSLDEDGIVVVGRDYHDDGNGSHWLRNGN